MSRAEPMGAVIRADNYHWQEHWQSGELGRSLTPRQRRRIEHKANRARKRQLIAEDTARVST